MMSNVECDIYHCGVFYYSIICLHLSLPLFPQCAMKTILSVIQYVCALCYYSQLKSNFNLHFGLYERVRETKVGAKSSRATAGLFIEVIAMKMQLKSV